MSEYESYAFDARVVMISNKDEFATITRTNLKHILEKNYECKVLYIEGDTNKEDVILIDFRKEIE